MKKNLLFGALIAFAAISLSSCNASLPPVTRTIGDVYIPLGVSNRASYDIDTSNDLFSVWTYPEVVEYVDILKKLTPADVEVLGVGGLTVSNFWLKATDASTGVQIARFPATGTCTLITAGEFTSQALHDQFLAYCQTLLDKILDPNFVGTEAVHGSIEFTGEFDTNSALPSLASVQILLKDVKGRTK